MLISSSSTSAQGSRLSEVYDGQIVYGLTSTVERLSETWSINQVSLKMNSAMHEWSSQYVHIFEANCNTYDIYFTGCS